MSLHVDLAAFYKHTNYEQSNRIPLIIVAPSITKPASVTRQLAESADVFPTLAELAGLPIPTGPQPIDGKSLVPVLRDPAVRVRDHAYHVFPKGNSDGPFAPSYVMVAQGRYKYILASPSTPRG